MNIKRKVIIRTLLDIWDPLMLFPLAPDDEYENEVEKVCEYMNLDDTTVEDLGAHIYYVYKNAFGSTFNYSQNDCNWIAKKIIHILVKCN